MYSIKDFESSQRLQTDKAIKLRREHEILRSPEVGPKLILSRETSSSPLNPPLPIASEVTSGGAPLITSSGEEIMVHIQRWTVKEPYIAIKCNLGEGVFYNEERHELRFLDINNCKLYIVDLSKGPSSLKAIDTKVPVGITADIEGRGDVILTGAKDGVTKFHLATGEHEYIAKYFPGEESSEKAKSMRANDGAVDSAGRFWVEIFVDPTIKDPDDSGKLFRLESDGSLRTMCEKVTIPNGLSWNPKNDTMFFTDSPAQNVYAFDYDPKTGDISNKRTFFHLDEDGVHPDGHMMDVDGYIWHACYHGSKVIRISPDGKIVGEISLPTRCITCVAFVGTELFITSAKEPEPEKYPDSAKFGGDVFRVDVGVEGMPKHKARLP